MILLLQTVHTSYILSDTIESKTTKTENDIHNFRENDTFAIPFKSGTVECSDKKCKPFRDIVPLNIGWEQEFASKSC